MEKGHNARLRACARLLRFFPENPRKKYRKKPVASVDTKHIMFPLRHGKCMIRILIRIRNMLEKVTGHCQLRGGDVEILFVELGKGKGKAGVKTPVRCQSSGKCPKSAFCKFVNPLSNRIPVELPSSAKAV